MPSEPVLFNKEHRNCEGFDRVEIECVERWKESHLSGDEWRFSYVVRAYFKGAVVLEYSRSGLREAVAHLPYEMDQVRDKDAANTWQERRENCCDQPGCARKPTRWFRINAEYSAQGEGPLPSRGFHHYRKFCERHSRRGDCALEDADANYTEIRNPRVGCNKEKVDD